MIDTAELRRLLAEATPGEWRAVERGNSVPSHVVVTTAYDGAPSVNVCSGISPRTGNAALIVAAVNALPALLDEVERLTAANAALLARAEAAEAKLEQARAAIETAQAVSIDLLDFIDEHASVYFACVLEDNYGNRLRALAGKEGE